MRNVACSNIDKKGPTSARGASFGGNWTLLLTACAPGKPLQRLAAEAHRDLLPLSAKLVFHNSDLDKLATVWARELLKQWAIHLGSSL